MGVYKRVLKGDLGSFWGSTREDRVEGLGSVRGI